MLYTKNPARLEANRAAKVANGAITGTPNRKIKARLNSRIADYYSTISNTKVDYKGYKKPGSMQK